MARHFEPPKKELKIGEEEKPSHFRRESDGGNFVGGNGKISEFVALLSPSSSSPFLFFPSIRAYQASEQAKMAIDD